jgi:class 3 adenylate cyclase/predicted ATPase
LDLPTGTVTFLFTDIEGSTRLWDAFPDDMRRALAIHDAIVTEAVTSRSGHVVKQTGDGVFAAFDSAINACLAAADAQDGLASATWPAAVEAVAVRMALHTATIEPSGGDYHGSDVNRVARIEASGHGGQILLSAATHALVGDASPGGANFTDLGSHLLRGLSTPERVYQMALPGRQAVFPPLRTASAIRTSLPEFPTTFVGRETEIADVVSTLEDPECRVLTLVGPGGIGKTRLAVAAAAQASGRLGIASHFLSLVSITDVSDVIKALGDSIDFTFDIHISAQISEKSQLFDRLRSQPLILVLDNLEHLPGIGSLVAEMGAAIPSLSILATSRTHLDIAAEWRYEVAGLGSDGAGDAVELFVDRARRAGSTVDLETDLQTIESLAARVGGMPLAIELAAAWAGMLTPSEILEEIGADAGLLESSTSDAPDRHRSVRHVFEQSWSRLPEDLKPVYARLVIFAAPFERAAAAAVAGASLPDLAQLAKRSLLSKHGLDKFALHPLLREFASEQSDAQDPDLAARYARYYHEALMQRAARLQGGPGQMDARDEVAGILDHIRAASEIWVEDLSDEDAVETIRTLHEFYFLHSWVDEAVHFRRLRERYEQAFGDGAVDREAYLWVRVIQATTEVSFATPDELDTMLDPVEAPWRKRGGAGLAVWLTAKGIQSALRGDYPASIAYYEEALETGGDTSPLLDGVHAAWHGWSHLQLGHVQEADRIFDAGLIAVTDAGHYLGRAFLLSKYGLAAEAQGDHERAAQLHHEGREIFVKAGDLGGQGYTLSRLSWSYYLQGNFESARRYALDGLAKFEEINHRWGIAVSYGRLGLAELALGHVDAACNAFLTCLRKAQEAGLVEQQHYAVTGLGRALVQEGHEAGARILAFEAAAEGNPYAEFARMGLGDAPEGARIDPEPDMDLAAVTELAIAAVAELTGRA